MAIEEVLELKVWDRDKVKNIPLPNTIFVIILLKDLLAVAETDSLGEKNKNA